MWVLYVSLYVICFIIHTQLYKVALRSSRNPGALTVIMFMVASVTALVISWFIGDYRFPTDWHIYLVPLVAGLLYGITGWLNAYVRQAIEASTFSVLSQISTAFVLIIGMVVMGESPSIYKSIGAGCIIISNLLIFYRRGQRPNKYVIMGLVASLIFAIALSCDVGASGHFNIAFYKVLTTSISVPAMMIAGRVHLRQLSTEFRTNRISLIATIGILQGAMLVIHMAAYNTGEVAVVTPLCSLTVIGNVIVGYLFLKERDHLSRKIIAAAGIICGVVFINLSF